MYKKIARSKRLCIPDPMSAFMSKLLLIHVGGVPLQYDIHRCRILVVD